ncbi:MAG: hypothetical protein DHS20C11_23850 [Lysobacteraceae bacterium]|nr:MAG: hypothetical protein DHS20C11_23850 [Xanthomonadaceae bacterium]
MAHIAETTIDQRGLFRLQALKDSANRDRNLAAILALCHNAYLGDHRSLCRILGRFEILVDTRDDALATHLLSRGIWEMHVTECLARAISPGMTVVDVGANYGYFAVLMAALAGPKGRLIAIEANPAAADLLQVTLKRNGFMGRSKLHRVAVADKDQGTAWLRYAADTMNGNIHDKAPKLKSEQDRLVEVPLATLDSLIAPGTRVDVMKVDIEGAERAMWQGARRVLAENPKIAIALEVDNKRYADAAAFFEQIEADGFKLQMIEKNGEVRSCNVKELVEMKNPSLGMLWLKRQ